MNEIGTPTRVLVVDDEVGLRRFLKKELGARGFLVEAAESGEQAIALVRENEFDVVLLDVRMPGMDGLTALKHIRQVTPTPEVLILTGQGTVDSAVEAMRAGAFHYLTKPFHMDGLEAHILKAREQSLLARRAKALERIMATEDTDLVGGSAAIEQVRELIRKVAPSDTSVVIEGESGTGKELVARAIHSQSRRARRPFVVINCGALQETLLESELFGHEKGAFTGASRTRQGLAEAADGGTLFLDEVGELGLSMQSKLLRFLESGEIRRVGSNRTHSVDVRVVSATNRRLGDEVQAGTFREDLYYRLRVFALEAPPLRERLDDVPRLVAHFLSTIRAGRGPFQIDAGCMAAMEGYAWPGNVRELRNAVERMMILADDGRIDAACLPPEIGAAPSVPAPGVSTLKLADLEKAAIERALAESAGRKTEAARLLGISIRTLYNRLAQYATDPPEVSEE